MDGFPAVRESVQDAAAGRKNPPAPGPAEIREDCVRLQRGHMGKGLYKSKTKQYPAQK